MGVVLSIVLNLLLLTAFGVFVALLFGSVLQTDQRGERLFRVFLMLVAATIVLAAQASGVSYADFIVDSLGAIKPATFGIVGVVAPTLAGAGLSWYLGIAGKKNDYTAGRVLALVGMLAATQFVTLFGVALSAEGFDMTAAVVPNASFIVGFAIYAMLKWPPELLPFGTGGGAPVGAFGNKRQRG